MLVYKMNTKACVQYRYNINVSINRCRSAIMGSKTSARSSILSSGTDLLWSVLMSILYVKTRSFPESLSK